MLVAALLTSKLWNQPGVHKPVMDTENVVHIHSGALPSHKKWNYVTFRKMDGITSPCEAK
jgi:hypothetical protein